jgi:uncharacterized membrane protein
VNALNFLLLFGIAIQPITTNLLGGFEQPMVVVYAANMVFVSAILFVMWAYALIGRRLVEPSIGTLAPCCFGRPWGRVCS